jgi:hypothetical protein
MSDHHKIIPFTPKGKGDGGKSPMEPYEKRFQAIETDLEVIKATMATKGELHQAVGTMIKWTAGTSIAVLLRVLATGATILISLPA